MQTMTNPLTALAARARMGDRVALESLRQQLQCRITGAVRRVLRTGGRGGVLDEAILREYRAVRPGGRHEDALVAAVAGRLSGLAVDSLADPTARQAASDTLRGR